MTLLWTILPQTRTLKGGMLGHILVHLALGESKAGQFFGSAMMLLFVLALPILGAFTLSALACQELAKESAYRERHGAEWKVRYAVEQGSLVEARVKVAVEIIGAVTIVGIGIWLYRMILPALRGEGYASYSPGKRHRKRKRHLQTPRSPAPETMIASATAKAFVPPQRESSAPPKIRRMDDADSRGQTT